jgi:hypothetical protein
MICGQITGIMGLKQDFPLCSRKDYNRKYEGFTTEVVISSHQPMNYTDKKATVSRHNSIPMRGTE